MYSRNWTWNTQGILRDSSNSSTWKICLKFPEGEDKLKANISRIRQLFKLRIWMIGHYKSVNDKVFSSIGYLVHRFVLLEIWSLSSIHLYQKYTKHSLINLKALLITYRNWFKALSKVSLRYHTWHCDTLPWNPHGSAWRISSGLLPKFTLKLWRKSWR